VPIRGFVPIEEVQPPRTPGPDATPESALPQIVVVRDPGDGWDARTSLFGEVER
jgi:hypothetical protein